MSAVAKLLVDQGHTVTGSDEGFYPPVSLYLTTNNIPCTTPFSKENIPSDVDYIVIGKHAKLIPEENEEVAFAFSSGKKILSFPEVLTMLVENKQSLVIAGSYGKSSCTALMSWCLEQAGVDASYFIGAVPLTPNTNAHLGKSETFVIEGDEYPSSNWDSTSKFLHYNAHDVLLTALAHDHVNIFKTHEDYIQPFISLIEKLPKDGKLIVCLDDETIRSKVVTLTRPYITYGLTKDATWYGDTISYGHTTTFNLMKNGEFVATLSTTLLGAHNIQNIIGVSAMLLEKKLISVNSLVSGVLSFKGIVRRLDKKSEKTSIPIYEGFGSSFDKARSAIEAIKTHFPTRNIVIIFEPHTFSWRNRQALPWYDTVFTGAKRVFIYKPPEHGSTTHEQLTLTEIASRVKQTGLETYTFEHVEEGVKHITSLLTKDDVVLILSSGGMDGLLDTLIPTIENLFPL